MIAVPYDRTRVLRGATAALILFGLAWYAREHRPAALALAAAERDVAAREERVRAARAATVMLGPAGLDSVLSAVRGDSLRLARRVPASGHAGTVAAEVKEALARAERAGGVRITASEPLPASTEGPFQTGGYAVRLVGSYDAVRLLLAEVLALDRLIHLRAFRLHAVPDSLVAGAEPYGAAADGAGHMAPLDADGTAGRLASAGEHPFQAAVSFHLLWYTHPAHGAEPTTPEVQR